MNLPRFLSGCLALLAPAAADARLWVVAGAMNGPGANGLSYASELVLVNSDDVPQFVSLIPILPPGSPISDPLGFSLGPGETRAVPAPLSVPGGLAINAGDKVEVFARIDSMAGAPGALGLVHSSPLPVFREDQWLQAGETGHAVWVSHSRNFAQGTRTNVGIAFPGGGAATVTLYDPEGAVLGSIDYDVDRAAFVQSSLSAFTGEDVPIGRIAIRVTRGSACAYAGVVDNQTGALALVAARRLDPAPDQTIGQRDDLVSPGVAQAAGLHGTFWLTDVRLANPGPAPVVVTAILPDIASPSALQSIPLGAGRVVDIEDVVQSLFNISQPYTGTILWRATGPVSIAARTRSAAAGGDLAFGIANAVPLSDFVASVDPEAEVGGLRQDGDYRTNVFTVAGPAGASVAFALFDEMGNPSGSSGLILPPLGAKNSSLPALFPEGTLPARGRLSVRVLRGSATVQASVVDDAVNNPVLYGALPPGVRVPPPMPPVPAGAWGGAPNGMDHLLVDASSVAIFRPCQSGTYAQPLWLDADGGFGTLGTESVQVGPSIQVEAVLVGRVQGSGATVQVMALAPSQSGLIDASPETFLLGAPYGPFTEFCPIEYRPGR